MAEKKGKVEIIKPSRELKDKVGPIQPSAEDLRAIKRAEAVIASLKDKYLDVVDEDLANLQDAAIQFKEDAANRDQHLRRIFLIAHDMKGQGGSFGYPLITTISNQLCRFIERVEDNLEEADVEVVSLHVDALQVVIRDKMTKADSDQAKAMLKGLELVIEKVGK
jgi:chemotaxis protein histidine kinase CheA